MILLGQLLRHFSMNFITEKDHFCITVHDKSEFLSVYFM